VDTCGVRQSSKKEFSQRREHEHRTHRNLRAVLALVQAGRTPDELAPEFEPSAQSEQIRKIHARSDGTYGAPRIHA
jgi:hypothetical protein